MRPKKRWDGYRSFDYLVPGEDFREFDLSPQIGRVIPYVVRLSAEQEAGAERLLHDCVFSQGDAAIGEEKELPGRRHGRSPARSTSVPTGQR